MATRTEAQYRIGWKNGSGEDRFSTVGSRAQADLSLTYATRHAAYGSPRMQVRVVTVTESDWEDVQPKETHL